MLSPKVIDALSATLKPDSVKRYIRWSNVVSPDEYSVEDFVNFHKKIDAEFKERKDFTSIMSVIIKVLEIEGKDTSVYEALKKKAFGEADVFTKATPKQIDNKISVQSIVEMRDKLEKKKDRSMREDFELQFLYMITEISPFRGQDYISGSFSKLTPNFVDLKSKEIIYTEGKVQSSTRVVKLPPRVFDIIKANKDKYDRNWLFPTLNKPSEKAMSRETFTRFLNQLFNAPISTTMLRNIFVSHYADIEMSKKERLEKAEQMGHTFQTSEKVYTKLSKDKLEKEKPKETLKEKVLKKSKKSEKSKEKAKNEELIKCLQELIQTLSR
jgi:hypothetical protein